MKITIAGKPGSGKSTVANLLADTMGMKHFSIGDFMREIAEERNMSILELSQIAEKDKSIDKALDDRQLEIGKSEDEFVIDSRLGWFFMPDSIKIFLDVNLNEAARRIFEHKRSSEKNNTSLDQTYENLIKRIDSEKKRYRSLYKVDYYDFSHYDIVIDTTNLSPKEVVDEIIKFLKDL